jgi:uncharacterized protein YktA (UPF0223 family)
MEIMEENEAYKPLPLEITFNQTEDLLELSQNKKYRKFILEETYRALKTNIPLKSEKIQLFDIINFGFIISVSSENYSKCLYSVLKHFESIEDYDSCSDVKELLKQL